MTSSDAPAAKVNMYALLSVPACMINIAASLVIATISSKKNSI